MSDYVTAIRTSDGDKKIDYNALANKPNKFTTISANGVNITPEVEDDTITLKSKSLSINLNSDGTIEVEVGGNGYAMPFRGQYNATTIYYPGDCILMGQNWYKCLSKVQGVKPGTNASAWELIGTPNLTVLPETAASLGMASDYATIDEVLQHIGSWRKVITKTEIFTTSSTWTVPIDCTSIFVRLFGAGGGGNTYGGGGGGYMETGTFEVTPGDTYTITIGTGATAAAGGASSFGTLLSASGGGVATSTKAGSGGSGGGACGFKGVAGGDGAYGGGGGGSGAYAWTTYDDEDNYYIQSVNAGAGGKGGTYGGGGGGGGGIYVKHPANSYTTKTVPNGSGGSGSYGNGGSGGSSGSNGSAGSDGVDTTALDLEFTGTGMGGNTINLDEQ